MTQNDGDGALQDWRDGEEVRCAVCGRHVEREPDPLEATGDLELLEVLCGACASRELEGKR